MSTFVFNVNEYLIEDTDGDGTYEYVLSDPADPTSRILIGSNSYSVDGKFRPVGSNQGRSIPKVFSFEVKKKDEGVWYLTVNRNYFCGIYPSQAACLGVLFGMMTYNSGRDEGFGVWLEESLNTRGSVIDPDINVLSLTHTTVDITVELSQYDSAPIGSDTPFFGWQKVLADGSYEPITASNLSIRAVPVAIEDGGQQSHTFTSAWNDVPEGNGARPVLLSVDNSLNISIIAFGSTTIKPLPETLVSVSISPSTVDDPLENGQALQFEATAVGTATDIQYLFRVTGDTAHVTSDLSTQTASRFYTLQWTDALNTPLEAIQVEVEALSINVGEQVSAPPVNVQLQHTQTASIDFDVEVSGAATAGVDVEVGGTAFVVIDDNSTGGTPSFTNEWFMEIATLNGITIENQGGGS